MKAGIKTLISIMLLFSFLRLHAQDKVNVLTKTISKEISYKEQTIKIIGEKSNIYIRKWDKPFLKIDIKLIAKNKVKASAKEDLEIMMFSMKNEENLIELKNFFKAEKIHEITSNLSAEYSLYVPDKCKIQLVNLYGDVSIEGLNVNGSISNSFGSLQLNSINANLQIKLHYSDINAKDITGHIFLNATNSDIVFSGISGNYKLNTLYGTIDLNSIHKLEKLEISGKRTKVSMSIKSFDKYNFSLSTIKDKIIVPAKYKSLVINDSGSMKFIKSSKLNNSITIKTSYCPINLKTE